MEVRSRRVAPPAGDRPFFQGTADQVVADIRAYAAAGVTHFVFDHTHQDLRALLENLERFAHEVRPKLEARRASDSDGTGTNGRARTSKASKKNQKGTRSRRLSRSGHPHPKAASRHPLQQKKLQQKKRSR
jgi:hypothetical protein